MRQATLLVVVNKSAFLSPRISFVFISG